MKSDRIDAIRPIVVPIIKEYSRFDPTISICDASSFNQEGLGVDSFDQTEIWMLLENMFSIRLADGEIDDIKTLRDLLELLDRKIPPNHAF